MAVRKNKGVTMKFLSTPKHGWSTLTLKDKHKKFSIPVSYLTDIPFDCLDMCISSLKNKHDLCLNFETEGKGDVKVIADDYTTYVIHETDKPKLIVFDDITKTDIIDSIHHHMDKDIDEWAKWMSYEYNDNAWKRRKPALKLRIHNIERLMGKSKTEKESNNDRHTSYSQYSG